MSENEDKALLAQANLATALEKVMDAVKGIDGKIVMINTNAAKQASEIEMLKNTPAKVDSRVTGDFRAKNTANSGAENFDIGAKNTANFGTKFSEENMSADTEEDEYL